MDLSKRLEHPGGGVFDGNLREVVGLVAQISAGQTGASPGDGQGRHASLIPPEFLKIIAVWSLIPSYLLAGGLIGYAADQWLHYFPYLTGLGLLLALALAVRDMYRLRKEWF